MARVTDQPDDKGAYAAAAHRPPPWLPLREMYFPLSVLVPSSVTGLVPETDARINPETAPEIKPIRNEKQVKASFSSALCQPAQYAARH